MKEAFFRALIALIVILLVMVCLMYAFDFSTWR